MTNQRSKQHLSSDYIWQKVISSRFSSINSSNISVSGHALDNTDTQSNIDPETRLKSHKTSVYETLHISCSGAMRTGNNGRAPGGMWSFDQRHRNAAELGTCSARAFIVSTPIEPQQSVHSAAIHDIKYATTDITNNLEHTKKIKFPQHQIYATKQPSAHHIWYYVLLAINPFVILCTKINHTWNNLQQHWGE